MSGAAGKRSAERAEAAAAALATAGGMAAGAAAAAASRLIGGRGAEDAKEAEGDAQEGAPGTGEREASLRAQLLVAQQRIAAMEAAASGAAAKSAVAAADEADRYSAEANEALGAAQLAQEEEEAAGEALDAAAVVELQRPGERDEVAELQRRIAQAVAAELARERKEAAAAAAAAAAIPSTPQRLAVAQRSMLRPSPAVESPPVIARAGQNAAAAGGQLQGAGSMAAWHGSASFKVPQPAELRAAEAAKGTTLEDWIFSMERLIKREGAGSFAARMELAEMFWDRQVNTWWTGAQEVAKGRGQPIVDWSGFLTALRANYTPVSDVDTACTMLFQLAMHSGESMDRYVGRAHELFNRIPRSRIPTEVAAEFLQRGVDARRFPLALVAVGMEQQQERARSCGNGLSFDAMRSLLVEAAVREPTHLVARAQAAASDFGAQRGGHGHSAGKHRVNNVATHGQARYPGPEDEEDGEEEEGTQGVNALDVADIKCFKCQGRGHFARDCSKPETRQCRLCQKKGHLAQNCPTRGGERRGGEGAGGKGGMATQAPKNE